MRFLWDIRQPRHKSQPTRLDTETLVFFVKSRWQTLKQTTRPGIPTAGTQNASQSFSTETSTLSQPVKKINQAGEAKIILLPYSRLRGLDLLVTTTASVIRWNTGPDENSCSGATISEMKASER